MKWQRCHGFLFFVFFPWQIIGKNWVFSVNLQKKIAQILEKFVKLWKPQNWKKKTLKGACWLVGGLFDNTKSGAIGKLAHLWYFKRCFVFSILWCSKSGYHLWEDLSKFNYEHDIEQKKKFKTSFCVLVTNSNLI